jgi:hypothetical protein
VSNSSGAGCSKPENSKETSQQLVYKFGNISSEILSESIGVFSSEVLK